MTTMQLCVPKRLRIAGGAPRGAGTRTAPPRRLRGAARPWIVACAAGEVRTGLGWP